jgi:hypothetical protein
VARARSIKPGFFLNDELAELDPLTRLLFAGLWTIADRAGRLPDRPKKIKAAVLPYDDLQSRGFISRYLVDDGGAIQIHNWSKHQYPHLKEPPSVIPEQPQSKHHTSTVQAPDKNGARTRRARSAKPVENGASTDMARGEHESKTPGTFNHNLDTGTGNTGISAAHATAANEPTELPFRSDDVDKRSPVAIVTDHIRAAGLIYTPSGRDGKALKDALAALADSINPRDFLREVADCHIAIASGTWGGDYERRRQGIHFAVEVLNAYRQRGVRPIASARSRQTEAAALTRSRGQGQRINEIKAAEKAERDAKIAAELEAANQ